MAATAPEAGAYSAPPPTEGAGVGMPKKPSVVGFGGVPDAPPAALPAGASRASSSSFKQPPSAFDGDLNARIGSGVRRRQVFRICSTVPVLLLPFLLYYVVLVLILTVGRTATFDARVRLTLSLSSCDLVVQRCCPLGQNSDPLLCEQPTLGHSSSAFLYSSKYGGGCDPSGNEGLLVYLNGDILQSQYLAVYKTSTDTLESADLKSSAPCAASDLSCKDQCVSYLYVPDGAKEVLVQQGGEDKAPFVRVNVRGVNMQKFTVSGSSVRLEVRDSTVSSNLWASTGLGQISVVDSDLAGARLKSSGNSVFVVLKPHEAQFASELLYRSQSAFGCFSANDPDVPIAVDDAGDWSRVTAFWGEDSWSRSGSEWPVCSLQTEPEFTACARSVASQFDADGNKKVTVADFSTGVDALGVCCGSSCPFKSKCAAMHQYTFVPFDRSYTGLVDFVNLVKSENMTWMVPKAHRYARIGPPNAPATRTFKLTSDHGSVFFAHNGWPTASAAHFAITEGGSLSLRLLREDADRLTSEVRDVYGKGPSGIENNVWVVLDVVAAPGIPAARFVYTNQPVFVVLEPALMEVLSFGQLAPKVLHYNIHFLWPGCTAGNATTAEPGIVPVGDPSFLSQHAHYVDNDQRLLDIAAQLYKALTPWPRVSLWGSLVYVNQTGHGKHRVEDQQLYEFRKDIEGTLVMFNHARSLFDESTASALWALVLSLVIGVVGSIVLLALFDRFGVEAMQKRFLKDQIRARVLRQSAMMSKSQDVQKESESALENTDEQDDITKLKIRSPFERPIELIDVLIVDPLMAEFTDSFKKFVDERCKLDAIAKEKSAFFDSDDPLFSRLFGVPLSFIPTMTSKVLAEEETPDDKAALGLDDLDDDNDTIAEEAARKEENRNSEDRTDEDRTVEAGVDKLELAEAGTLHMKVFMRRYERFCDNKNLNFIDDVVAVRRRLVAEFGVQPRQRVVERIVGMQWRSAKDPSKVLWGTRAAPVYDMEGIVKALKEEGNLKEADVGELSLNELLVEFVKCRKFLYYKGLDSNSSRHFVSFDDMLVTPVTDPETGASEKPEKVRGKGFLTVFCDFCHALGVDGVENGLNDAGAVSRMPHGTHPFDDVITGVFGARRAPVKVETLRHLKLLTFEKGRRSKLTWRTYALYFVKVLLHAIFLALPAIAMIVGFTEMELVFGKTMDMPDPEVEWSTFSSYERSNPFLVLQRWAHYKFRSDLTNVVITVALLYTSIALIFLWVSYASPKFYPFGFFSFCVRSDTLSYPVTLSPILTFIVRKLMSWLLRLLFAFLLVWLNTNLIWVVLAALLKPSEYLPFATMVATAVAVLAWQYGRLKRAAESITATIKAQYQSRLRKSIAAITRARIIAQQMDNESLREDGLRRRGKKSASLEIRKVILGDGDDADGDGNANFDPAVLFDLLDKDGDESLCKQEFFSMFAKLGIRVSQGKKEQMLAYSDSKLVDGSISRDEFVDAWDWLEERLIEEIAGDLGVSGWRRSLALLTLAFLLLCVFGFLIVAITAFQTNGGFQAVVQSGVVSIAAAGSSKVVKTPKGEELKAASPEELKKYINDKISNTEGDE